MTQQGQPPAAHDRVLKVARTLADLEGADAIEPKHILEVFSIAHWIEGFGREDF